MARVFTLADQVAFAELSGDYNPMHIDLVAARRLLFGRPVVHGIHAVLWAIDVLLDEHYAASGSPVTLEILSVDFRSPMLVGEPIDLKIVRAELDTFTIEISSRTATAAVINLSIAADKAEIPPDAMPDSLPDRLPCREPLPGDVKSAAGTLPLYLSLGPASAMFPTVTRLLDRSQFASLLASTRLVGMEMPGLHSLYTGLDLTGSDRKLDPVLTYAAVEYDERFAMVLNLSVTSPGFKGRIATAFRPAPTRQASAAELKKRINAGEFAGERALIIGGSRGLGEIAVKLLVAGGADVRFTYYKGAADADRVIADAASMDMDPPAIARVSTFAFDVYKQTVDLAEALAGWKPTLLCYFATPAISSAASNQFAASRFAEFCSCYIDGFLRVFDVVSGDLRSVLYPSSSAIEELPPNMGEYAAAKAAAENLCLFLEKANPAVRFHTPRYSRLATDQTASVLAVETGDANAVVLDSLRRIRAGAPAARHTTVAPSQSGPPIVVAATFTAEPIEPSLRFWMAELGSPGGVEFAQYNQVFQALLDPAGLVSRQNFSNAVLIRFEDWIEQEKTGLKPEDWHARIEPLVDELIQATRAVPRSAPTFFVVCPASEIVLATPGTDSVLRKLTDRLVSGLKSIAGVYAFGPTDVTTLYPVADYYDAGADAVGKIPYTAKFFAALGTFFARTSVAVRRTPFKVIVLDCDNTLWSGVCGEGGVAAVKIGPGFRAMQQFMVEQAARGKILCLCSKNVEADVWDVFANHPEMLLKREHVIAHRVNWSPKGENLRALAGELNVGLDSFIFLDDNPVECAEVRSSCPEVLTLQAPTRDVDWPGFLNHVWAFDQLTVTEQDRQRSASYLQNARREEVRKDSAGLGDFLSKLQLEVTIGTPTPAQMPRVAQLTERTNQFNFSTVRRSEAEIVALLGAGTHRCHVVEVKDRFGDYGLVGIVITRTQADAAVIDTMLLSCRVLGRGVEHRMLASVGAYAKSAGLGAVDIPFVQSKKNQPALDFLNAVAGDYRTETSDGFQYQIPAEIAATIEAKVATPPPPDEGVAAASASPRSESANTKAGIYQHIASALNNVDAILAAVEAQPLVENSNQTKTGFVAPRNDRERKLAAIWQSVLKLPQVGIHDDYFAIGGTSLLAVRLVLEIEKQFGRQIPIATLLKAPTVEKLAAVLTDPVDADDLAVVQLRVEGSGTPLLLLPGVGGHVLSYKRLAELLDTDRPVYGFEMRAETPGNRIPRTMEKIAEEFIERILRVQPQGPYLLAGWSFGGALAFEITQQLRKQGRTVGLVAMFDTWGRGFPGTVPLGKRIPKQVKRFFDRGTKANFNYVLVISRVQALLAWHRLLKVIGVRKTDYYNYESPLIEEMVAASNAALGAYQPRRLDGSLVLFKAAQRPDLIGIDYSEPNNGWTGLADRIEIRPVDTHHLGFFEEPAVHQTAALLGECVKEALAKLS